MRIFLLYTMLHAKLEISYIKRVDILPAPHANSFEECGDNKELL